MINAEKIQEILRNIHGKTPGQIVGSFGMVAGGDSKQIPLISGYIHHYQINTYVKRFKSQHGGKSRW